jgi:diguanylate cyclase (GGDEF)-like protein
VSTARPRLYLAGDASARPPGLERALTRGGFQVSEAAAHPPLLPADAILITLLNAQDNRLQTLLETESLGPPRVVLFASHDLEAPVTALALGADDALSAPVHLPELLARVQARIRDRQAPRRTPYESEIRETLQDLVAEARTMLQPDEIVVALVRRLTRAFSLAQCSFVITTPGDAEGRILADIEPGATDSGRLDLATHPEIEEAIRTRRPVMLPLGEGQNSLSATVALPVLRRDAVPAVLLLRGRDPQTALSPAQLEMASSLAQVAAQALDGGQASPSSPDRADTVPGGELDRRLQEEFERARRYSLSFSLVLLDVQPGTRANGDSPHETAERLRREVGARLRRELRLPDFLARYGGEEFAIVLPETGLEGAVQSVTRVQERLAILPFESGSRPQFSAGVVSYPHPAVTQPDDLFALVEAALMRGKLQTGGRIGRAD